MQRIEPQEGQESVWDYPRPPRLEATTKQLRILFGGEEIANTVSGWRVLETSHPPVYYLPLADIRIDYLIKSPRSSFCEFKGVATYWTLQIGRESAQDAAWSYEAPTADFESIRGYLAFYASRMQACYVDGEQVQAQVGDFYGGWITEAVVGPFKGGVGTWGW
ncbi:MAG: DUF427 domain-containing protein [Anaerolineae bacterium]|nr:DUF427 domain-containing protein [Gloeobacterales cyanobacterium ES-bin-313]